MQCGEESLKFREIESVIRAHSAAQVHAERLDSCNRLTDVCRGEITCKKDRDADSVTNAAAGSPVMSAPGPAEELYRRCCVAGIEEECMHMLGSRAC
jgi:hypothetical protein